MEFDSATPVINLRGLTKRYGMGNAEHTVLDSVDLTIEKGEFIAIMGPSGCGKTTLLNILGLLDRADDGDYLLNGKSVDSLSSAKHASIRSSNIGFVFQSFNLVPRLTVIENVALPLTYKGVRKVKRLQLASHQLANFHLSEREYYLPYQLSGGQTQRVAIARALVNDPSIVLADEPTGNLDSRSSHVIMEELSDIHKRGNTIIMVTHNPALTTYASRVIQMIDGQIASDTKTSRQPTKKLSGEKRTLDANRKANSPAKKPAQPKKATKTKAKPKAKPRAKTTSKTKAKTKKAKS
jgi:putative ABC transport system ATP-binding protein